MPAEILPDPTVCPERQRIAERLAASIREVHRLESILRATERVSRKWVETQNALFKAKQERRFANSDMRKHIKQHGCGE